MPSKPPPFLAAVPCPNQVHVFDELGLDAFYGRTRQESAVGLAVATGSVWKNEKPARFVIARRIRQSEWIGRTSRGTRHILAAESLAVQQPATARFVTQHQQLPPHIEHHEGLGLARHVNLVWPEPLDECLEGLRRMPSEPRQVMMRNRDAHDLAAVRASAAGATDGGALGFHAIRATF
jgi:hypothetical protein